MSACKGCLALPWEVSIEATLHGQINTAGTVPLLSALQLPCLVHGIGRREELQNQGI